MCSPRTQTIGWWSPGVEQKLNGGRGAKEDWRTSVILSTLTKRFWIYFEIRSIRIYQSGVGGGRGEEVSQIILRFLLKQLETYYWKYKMDTSPFSILCLSLCQVMAEFKNYGIYVLWIAHSAFPTEYLPNRFYSFIYICSQCCSSSSWWEDTGDKLLTRQVLLM